MYVITDLFNKDEQRADFPIQNLELNKLTESHGISDSSSGNITLSSYSGQKLCHQEYMILERFQEYSERQHFLGTCCLKTRSFWVLFIRIKLFVVCQQRFVFPLWGTTVLRNLSWMFYGATQLDNVWHNFGVTSRLNCGRDNGYYKLRVIFCLSGLRFRLARNLRNSQNNQFWGIQGNLKAYFVF